MNQTKQKTIGKKSPHQYACKIPRPKRQNQSEKLNPSQPPIHIPILGHLHLIQMAPRPQTTPSTLRRRKTLPNQHRAPRIHARRRRGRMYAMASLPAPSPVRKRRRRRVVARRLIHWSFSARNGGQGVRRAGDGYEDRWGCRGAVCVSFGRTGRAHAGVECV